MPSFPGGLFIGHALKFWSVAEPMVVGLALLKFYRDLNKNKGAIKVHERLLLTDFEKKMQGIEARSRDMFENRLHEASRKLSELTSNLDSHAQTVFQDENNTFSVFRKELTDFVKDIKNEIEQGKSELEDMRNQFMLDLEDKTVKAKTESLTAMLNSCLKKMEEKETIITQRFQSHLQTVDDKAESTVAMLRNLEAASNAKIKAKIDEFNESLKNSHR